MRFYLYPLEGGLLISPEKVSGHNFHCFNIKTGENCDLTLFHRESVGSHNGKKRRRKTQRNDFELNQQARSGGAPA